MPAKMETRRRESSSPPNAAAEKVASSSSGADAAPSGFILKLYDLVSGAPDEVMKVGFFEHDDDDAPLLLYLPCDPYQVGCCYFK